MQAEDLVVLTLLLEDVPILVTDLKDEARVTKVSSSIVLKDCLVVVLRKYIHLTLLDEVNALSHYVETEDREACLRLDMLVLKTCNDPSD